MISSRQQKFYSKILEEILSANIDLKYNGYLLKSLKIKDFSLKEKLKAYNIFFRCLIGIPNNKNLLELNNYEFNIFLEKIRVILAENNYILKIDEESYQKAINESKKTIDFKYFLKYKS